MTLTTIVALTSCISNLAVLVSLIFVMRQMRLSTRHQQATMRHGRVQQLQQLYQQAAQDDFIDVLIGGLAGDRSMPARDCNRFVWFSTATFSMFENMFDQHRDGIIDEATFSPSIAAMRSQLAMPGMRAAWMVVRRRYRQSYVDYVDGLMATTPADGEPDLASAWRDCLPAAPA